MAKRIYIESVKKWALRTGISVGSVVFLLFLYLSLTGAIKINYHSGDMFCAGTEKDPCIAIINFTAREDIFLYPVGYDPYGRNTTFQTDKPLKSWKIYRSWGKGWREIDLTEGCTGSWCGCYWCRKNQAAQYSYVFRKGKNYSIKIEAYKINPTDNVKWSFGPIDPMWYGTSDAVLREFGIDGMRIISFKLNSKDIKAKDYEAEMFKFSNEFKRKRGHVKQALNLLDKRLVNSLYNFSILVEVEYDEIRWNGTRYKLNKTPIKMQGFYDEFGNFVTPNIFMDNRYHKRINFRDIAEKGGYALAYESKGKYFIELKLDDINIKSLKIDPDYINQTDGFETVSFGCNNPRDIYGNGTDFWIVKYENHYIYHTLKNGSYIDGFDTSASKSGFDNPIGIWGNNTDFWITDYVDHVTHHTLKDGTWLDQFNDPGGAENLNGMWGNNTDLWSPDHDDDYVYHFSKTGTDLGGFSTSAFGSVEPRGIWGNETDFWISDNGDLFMYHTLKDGTNLTGGFDLSSFGCTFPFGHWSDGTDFWISDHVDSFVYHIALPPPPMCSPTLNEDWVISDEQICDGVSVTTGTGSINITTGGNLTLINGANVTTSKLRLQTTGDQVFICSGCQLRIT